MKKIVCLFLVVVALMTIGGCGKEMSQYKVISQDAAVKEVVSFEEFTEVGEYTPDEELLGEANKVMVEIKVKDCDVMKFELYPDVAPITVANFVKLAKEGFYDGLTFHRIIKGFMIQGGDPEGTGMGGSDETIKGEFSSNGVENKIAHKRGVISMARSDEPDSASSQFFIVHADYSSLDGNYAAFGQLIEGAKTLDYLATQTQVSGGNGEVKPENQPVIEFIKVVE